MRRRRHWSRSCRGPLKSTAALWQTDKRHQLPPATPLAATRPLSLPTLSQGTRHGCQHAAPLPKHVPTICFTKTICEANLIQALVISSAPPVVSQRPSTLALQHISTPAPQHLSISASQHPSISASQHLSISASQSIAHRTSAVCKDVSATWKELSTASS